MEGRKERKKKGSLYFTFFSGLADAIAHPKNVQVFPSRDYIRMRTFCFTDILLNDWVNTVTYEKVVVSYISK